MLLFLSGGWYVYQQRNEVHNNCGIEIYYQTDMQTTHDNMLLELFCQIISEPCFNTLRTKEQLGEPTKHKKMMQNISCVAFFQHSFQYTEHRDKKGLWHILLPGCEYVFRHFSLRIMQL